MSADEWLFIQNRVNSIVNALAQPTSTTSMTSSSSSSSSPSSSSSSQSVHDQLLSAFHHFAAHGHLAQRQLQALIDEERKEGIPRNRLGVKIVPLQQRYVFVYSLYFVPFIHFDNNVFVLSFSVILLSSLLIQCFFS
jgi:hypothetical protein